MAFLCGTGSFSHTEDDPWLPSTLTGSKRRQGSGSNNPYSTRGLEKFTMVLADLETRREKIIAAAGSQDVVVVQFVYSDSDDWVPIIVRPRERPRRSVDKPKKGDGGGKAQGRSSPPAERPKPKKGGGCGQAQRSSSPPEERPKPKKGRGCVQAQRRPSPPEERPAAAAPPPPQPAQKLQESQAAHDRAVRKSPSSKASVGEDGGVWWWRPSHYLPVAVALVLLCLAVFGRAFAICCTAIWWYTVPIAAASGGCSLDVRRSMKKNYGRGESKKRLGAAAGVEDAAAPAEGRRSGGFEGLASPRRRHARPKKGSR